MGILLPPKTCHDACLLQRFHCNIMLAMISSGVLIYMHVLDRMTDSLTSKQTSSYLLRVFCAIIKIIIMK